MVIGGSTKLGYQSAINYAEEATFGTVISTPAGSIKFNNESMKTNIEEILIPTIHTNRDHLDRMQGNVSVEGSIEYPLHHTDGILFLKHAVGGTVTSSLIGTAGAYAHIFDPTGGSLSFGTETSLSLLMRRGDGHYWQYGGNRVNSYTISGNIGETIQVTVDLVGAVSSNALTTIGAVSFSELMPFTFKDAKFYDAASIGALTTTSGEQYITNFEFTVGNNLASDDNVRSLGTNTVMDLPPNANRDVTLNVTQRFDTSTAYGYFSSGTARAVMIVLDNGVTISGSGGSTYSMRIVLPKVYLNDAHPNVGGPGVLTYTLPFRAVADSLTGYDFRVTLDNAVASY